MSGDDDRDTDFVKALEQAHNLGGQRRIQIASGLISHEQGRFAHDCARDAHALLLTDRQFERRDALPAEQSDLIERGAYTLVDLLERGVGDHQRQRDVIEYRPVHEQPVILQYDAEATPE